MLCMSSHIFQDSAAVAAFLVLVIRHWLVCEYSAAGGDHGLDSLLALACNAEWSVDRTAVYQSDSRSLEIPVFPSESKVKLTRLEMESGTAADQHSSEVERRYINWTLLT